VGGPGIAAQESASRKSKLKEMPKIQEPSTAAPTLPSPLFPKKESNLKRSGQPFTPIRQPTSLFTSVADFHSLSQPFTHLLALWPNFAAASLQFGWVRGIEINT